jgi:HEAT repeat protein
MGLVEGRPPNGKQASGKIGVFEVEIEIYMEIDGCRVKVRGDDLPEGFHISPATRLFANQDIRVGRTSFDDRWKVEGKSPAHVLAVLTTKVRRQIENLVESVLHSPLVNNNKTSRVVNEHSFLINADGINCLLGINDKIEENTRKMIDLLKLLSLKKADVPMRLRQNLKEEERGGVRREMLVSLVKEFGDSVDAWEACRDRLNDKDDGVKVIAATRLGKEGEGTLKSVFDKNPASSELLLGFDELLKDERIASGQMVDKALEFAFDGKDRKVHVLGLNAVKQENADRLFSRVLALAMESIDEELIKAAIRAMGYVGNGKAESFLLKKLEERGAVLLEAVESLAKVGTIRAVEPLTQFADSVLPTRLRRAAQSAIAQIQSRLGPAERGTLAVAETQSEEGAVSLTEGEGNISLGPDGSKGVEGKLLS